MKKIKYKTLTGEEFITDSNGIDYMNRMIEHIKNQYKLIDNLKEEINRLSEQIITGE